MADRIVQTSDTIEEFRSTYNSTSVDIGDISTLSVINSPTDIIESLNELSSAIASGVTLSADSGVSETLQCNGTETLIINGTANEIETTVSNPDTITIGLPSTVSGLTSLSAVDLTGTLQTASQPNITTVGTINSGTWQGTTIAVANGGTNATTEATARVNLGVEIGVDVQAYDSDLDTLSTNGVGTGPNQFIQLNASSELPAVDGSNLTGISTGGDTWNSITTNTTAVSKNAYAIDTSGGVVSLTLPVSASLGDNVRVMDLGSASINNITISRNGHNIQGSASDMVVSNNRAAFNLVYIDVTQGWCLSEV